MHGDPHDMNVAGIADDSRKVLPGYLFAAVPGTRTDGRRFIANAVERGARAVLAPHGTRPYRRDVVLVTSPDVRSTLARMAACQAGAQPATIAAVTGTNGKTSAAQFARQLWSMQGLTTASIGTLGLPGGAPGLTTPDPLTLHTTLADLARNGVTHVSLEASSHGLDQRRLDGVRIAVAGFTNFTRDHLDYHASPAEYLAAKLRLFADLLPGDGTAVVNADIPEYRTIADTVRGRVISYGRSGDDIRIVEVAPLPDGQDVAVDAFGRAMRLKIPLIGAFQIHNALCAAGMVIACGADPETALGDCARLTGVRGRLQMVARHPAGAPAFVDYAHTPDALAAVLDALRAHRPGRLVVVFGCGGDRDRGKRALMGEVVATRADVAIVTDDNPRTEDPAQIRSEILAAAPGATEIGDRADAIAEGVRLLGAGDMLVVAGKGHETGQIVGDAVLPFDDAEVVCRAVAAVGKGPG